MTNDANDSIQFRQSWGVAIVHVNFIDYACVYLLFRVNMTAVKTVQAPRLDRGPQNQKD